MYGDQPYGHLLPTPAMVKAFTLADVSSAPALFGVLQPTVVLWSAHAD